MYIDNLSVKFARVIYISCGRFKLYVIFIYGHKATFAGFNQWNCFAIKLWSHHFHNVGKHFLLGRRQLSVRNLHCNLKICKIYNYILLTKPNKALILGHSIVRCFQQFHVIDADVRFCEDLGPKATRRISVLEMWEVAPFRGVLI